MNAPFSVGTDMVETDRIRKSVSRERFLKMVFSEEELELFGKKASPYESMAANWAAKEAFAKALGTGVRGFELKEISCLRDELGAPYLKLSGKAQKAAEGLRFSVSLTHTKEYASAVVLAWSVK